VKKMRLSLSLQEEITLLYIRTQGSSTELETTQMAVVIQIHLGRLRIIALP
jgi:hypothetical protein